MSRLFITPRELDFISDITKEIIKDVVGQKIYYYHLRDDLSRIHEVYEESTEKVFDPPIDLDCRVEWQPSEVRTGRFGSEQIAIITAFVHERDLIDKEIGIEEGDYFSYGDTFFEITKAVTMDNIYGEVEHQTGISVTGHQARQGLIKKIPIGPTDETYSDPDAVQYVFVQQRGFKENSLGPTGDKRSLISSGKTTLPITGPAEVSPTGGVATADGSIDSSFYDES